MGVNSFGVPTINGWHALMTGEKPLMKGTNMISSVDNDDEGLPKVLKEQLGYYTTYVSPSSFTFDGKQNWVGRGWFDRIWRSIPDSYEVDLLNLGEVGKNSWVGDKATTRQAMFEYAVQHVAKDPASLQYTAEQLAHYTDQDASNKTVVTFLKQEIAKYVHAMETRPEKKQPLFVSYMNVDTHRPFLGFGPSSDYQQSDDDYGARLLESDERIGQLINFVRTLNANTIVAITGDHGVRERDLLDNGVIRRNRVCYGKNFGNDNLFNTGGVIADLSLDQRYVSP